MSETRYQLYDNLRKKKLDPNTLYVVDNLGHLRHLKHLYKDQDVGFFFRDNIWSMAFNEKNLMEAGDIKEFDSIKLKALEIDKEISLSFKEKDNYYGFGWSHNAGKSGIWSEGPISTLLFKTAKKYDGIKLEVFCSPYISSKNESMEFDIYVNDIFNKKVKFQTSKKDKKIDIFIKGNLIKDENQKIDFHFKNLVSPYETYESPDSRKLGILLKKIRISEI